MSESYFGRGWSFPPHFDSNQLGVKMLEDEADIVSSLEILLGTRPGERAMLPQYGCNLDELLFENLSTRLKTLIADNIQSAILYFEPRIQVETVKLYQDPANLGVVLIEIVYRVKVTNSRFNFVYPFYKLEGTDINLTTSVNQLPAEA